MDDGYPPIVGVDAAKKSSIIISRERETKMNREQREQAWMILGLVGAVEMMDASCSLADRLTEEHVNNRSAYISLMQTIANEIIGQRVD